MKGFYINLESREDRRKHFTENILTVDFFKNISLFKAIENKDGPVGCGMSHLAILEMMNNKPAEMEVIKEEYDGELEESSKIDSDTYVCVLEDDFMILNREHLDAFIMDFQKIDKMDLWDIIVLTPRGKTVESGDEIMEANGFKRIIENQTTTGYIIKKDFLKVLITNLKEAIEKMIKGENKDNCAIDQYWKVLQTKYRFYYYNKIFGGQLPGWSSIENRYVDYNQRFLLQHLY